MSVETYSSDSGEGLLALMLTDTARQRLENITTENPDRRLALAVDGTLLAVPRYSEPLTNGDWVWWCASEKMPQPLEEFMQAVEGGQPLIGQRHQPNPKPKPQLQPK